MEQVQVDQTIVCKDCGKTFMFSIRDQDFYRVHGFTPPKRCKPCRIEKKKTRPPQNNRE